MTRHSHAAQHAVLGALPRLGLTVLGREHFTLVTLLSLAACRAELAARIAPWSLSPRQQRRLDADPAAVFVGTVSAGGFAVDKRLRAGQRNSFNLTASGTFTPQPSGTRIDVTLALAPLVLVLLGLFVAVGALVAIALTADAVDRTPGPLPVLLRLLILLGVAAIGAAFAGLGRLLAAGDGMFLRRALRETFAAIEVDDAVPAAG